MEDEIIENLDLLINLDTLEQEDMWELGLDQDSDLNQSEQETK